MKPFHKKLQNIFLNNKISLSDEQVSNFINHINNYTEGNQDTNFLIDEYIPKFFKIGIPDLDKFNLNENDLILFMANSNYIFLQITDCIKKSNDVIISNLEVINTIENDPTKTLILHIDLLEWLSLDDSKLYIDKILSLRKGFKNIVLFSYSNNRKIVKQITDGLSNFYYSLLRHVGLAFNIFSGNNEIQSFIMKNRYAKSGMYASSFSFEKINLYETLYTFPIKELNHDFIFTLEKSLVSNIILDTKATLHFETIANNTSIKTFTLNDVYQTNNEFINQLPYIQLKVVKKDKDISIENFQSLLNAWIKKCEKLNKPLIILNELNQGYWFEDDPFKSPQLSLTLNLSNVVIELKTSQIINQSISLNAIVKKHPYQKLNTPINITRGLYE